jgi:uncharacterized protein (TIGR02246 family)
MRPRKIWQKAATAGKTRMRNGATLAGMENELRALYSAMMDGWDRGSGAAFAAPFDAELDFVAFDGTRFRGREELVRFHEPLFKTHLKGTRLVGNVTDVRLIGPDVAIVHARGGTIMRGRSTPSPERDSIQTLVAVRGAGVWRFVAFHNTRIRPMGRNALGTLCWLIGDWFWKWCLPRSVQLQPDHQT